MSDYTKITDYSAKDALSSGDAAKRVKGSEIGADFDAVAVAVATKANLATPAFTTGIGVGATAAGAGGIAFPATAVAVADANTLDDYEEGTFTPVLSFGGGTTGITYALQSGSYTKIGNRVEWSCFIILTSKGSSTGAAAISGLPFASANSDNAYAAVVVRASVVTYTGMIMAIHTKNTATVSFEQLSEAGSNTSMTDANFANTSNILLSGSYRV